MTDPRSRDGSPSESTSSPSSPVADAFGIDTGDSESATGSFLSALVPTVLARRAIAVSVTTDRDTYEPDEPVEITVEFENRLPVPVEVPTPRQRPWGWTIDDELEASDERRYTRARPSSFDFAGGERKRASFTWNGRFERAREDRRESVLPDPDEYEVRAFVATHEDAFEPSDSTTITIR
ncbi:hypothetical protein [Natronobacterium gregoryi]|uniref:DUF7974 domain-containing protein n=2 Tax=Natronobacterium gregoryi TaxID=44930 RepID=L0AHY3_NATGS|nr:hypothetical protein [Natronobacterium gregoryi]AFZ72645.1 hypothetical protein Natgr_1434 [Natronobacterium gregoryi SP2]ELY69066.1 hypothetical protein C490_08746 [Natronobacterium gregoryi SP2]PLK19119.1 hypothetical protein CYV19_16690 [Natronobacterium gregoryi SP2]SFI90552.1 hypothetical protein SAMN05443661_10926 [Natronobacterium gregoryi]